MLNSFPRGLAELSTFGILTFSYSGQFYVEMEKERLVVVLNFEDKNRSVPQYHASFIVAVSFIGGGNRSTERKPPISRKLLSNFIT
jgi:hypothetical protein